MFTTVDNDSYVKVSLDKLSTHLFMSNTVLLLQINIYICKIFDNSLLNMFTLDEEMDLSIIPLLKTTQDTQ